MLGRAAPRRPLEPGPRVHLVYGTKSAVSGMLLELNSRVDVLMIGYFLDDARVGIYSFASTLAEGVFQLLVVLQNNYNPLIARSLTQGADAPGPAQEEFHAMVRRGKRTTYLWMTLAGALVGGRLSALRDARRAPGVLAGAGCPSASWWRACGSCRATCPSPRRS